mmetsp:Transcript_4962/g.8891  ORF Transcript_4962/g.8891 Transcript_4962/m.8891 type:complete len:226 (-) Transcript_4962:48-725(-)
MAPGVSSSSSFGFRILALSRKLVKDRLFASSPFSFVRGTCSVEDVEDLRDGRLPSSSEDPSPATLPRCPVIASAIMRLKPDLEAAAPCLPSPSVAGLGEEDGNGLGADMTMPLIIDGLRTGEDVFASCAFRFSDNCAAILSFRIARRNFEALRPTTSASPLSVTSPALSASLANSAALAALRKLRTCANRLATSRCLSSSTAAFAVERRELDPDISCQVLRMAFT